MDDLIEALTIFKKYASEYGCKYPFHCEHDILYICGVEVKDVTELDKKRLDELGFHEDDDIGGFASFRFGSC